MHASNDLRNLKCLDGLHYSFEILRYSYTGLYEECTGLIENNEKLVSALSRCWTIVDCVHRIREISQAIPGLSNKNPDLKIFLNETESAEKCRHYIQHLRNNLSGKTLDPYPVWGTLSWIDPNDESFSHAAIIGVQIPGIQYHGCVYDTVEKKWVSKVTLTVKSVSFNFDSIFNSIVKFKEFVLPWIKTNYKSGVEVTAKIPIISMKVIV